MSLSDCYIFTPIDVRASFKVKGHELVEYYQQNI